MTVATFHAIGLMTANEKTGISAHSTASMGEVYLFKAQLRRGVEPHTDPHLGELEATDNA